MSAAPSIKAAPLCLPPLPLTRRPRRRLPAGSVDCHLHVFREGAPLAAARNYTPQMLGMADWLALADEIGVSRGVLVQPSVYGFDNSVLLAALAAAPDRLRGIVVMGGETSDDELAALHAQGVRGVRCNTRNPGGLTLDEVPDVAARIAPFGWVLQLQVRDEAMALLPGLVAGWGVPVILDHFGFVDAASPDAAADRLRAVLDAGPCYVKLSAPYRLQGGPGVGALAAALADSHPERLLWGSDWPHTELWDAMPDDADLVDELENWLGDDAIRQTVLVTNPQSLLFET